MKNLTLFTLLISLCLLLAACESNEDKRVRVKKELSEIIAKKNAADLIDHGIDDSLNMFKSTWEYHGQDVNGAIKASYSARNNSDHFTGDMSWLLFTKKLNLYGYRPSAFNDLMTSQAEEWKEFNDSIHKYIEKIDETILEHENSIKDNQEEIEKLKNKEGNYANYSRKDRKASIKSYKGNNEKFSNQINERKATKKIIEKIKKSGYASLNEKEKIDILVFHYEKNPTVEFSFSYLPLTDDPKKYKTNLKVIEKCLPILSKINNSGINSLSKEEKLELNPNNNYADNYEYDNNLIELRKEYIDRGSWTTKHWGYSLATDFTAGSIQVGSYEDEYHIEQTGDSIVPAIWGYQISYGGLTKALKENPLNSGKKVYKTYIGDSGSDKDRRNFVMYITKNGRKSNDAYPQLPYNFRVRMQYDETAKYYARTVASDKWSINEEQYQFFMKVYNNLQPKD
jgi:hypothetical protein